MNYSNKTCESYRDQLIVLVEDNANYDKGWIQPGWYVCSDKPLQLGPYPTRDEAIKAADRLAFDEAVKNIGGYGYEPWR